MNSGRNSKFVLFLIVLIFLRIFYSQIISAEQKNKQIQEEPTLLSFHEFFETDSTEIKPSAKLLALDGKRVKLVGFMVREEEPLRGAFYLSPQPVFDSEEGGGNADLPIESVLVIVKSYEDKEIPFVPGALEATGILQIGKFQDENGHNAAIQLILDQKYSQSPKSKKPKTNHR